MPCAHLRAYTRSWRGWRAAPGRPRQRSSRRPWKQACPGCIGAIENAYLAGGVSREKAVLELGQEAVEELDNARQAVERDVRWGLQ